MNEKIATAGAAVLIPITIVSSGIAIKASPNPKVERITEEINNTIRTKMIVSSIG